jgi:putative transposase
VLNISRSGYKDWVGRPQSPRDQRNTELLKLIRDIHETSRYSYGSPRVHAELVLGLDLEINRKRVERLMREAGIQGTTDARAAATSSTPPPRRIWSAGPSRWKHLTGCGSAISPRTLPTKGNCIAPLS